MSTPADPETELARFSGWFHTTSIAIEYWEIVVTSQRVVFCFVGQSYQSLLLKADMGASHRDRVADLSPDEVADFDDQNVVVPISSLESITLTSPTRFRTASLEFEWAEDSMTLRRKGTIDDAAETCTRLADEDDDLLPDVAITCEQQSLLPWR